jgi:glycosyltransferase involved in cell wall biosynthesis
MVFDHNKVEKAKVKGSEAGNDIVLDLPISTIERSDLPEVTIVTLTRNRKHFIKLAIDNWKRQYYPEEKLFWLIVDDSDDYSKGPLEDLKLLKDKRISFYYMSPIKEGKLISYSIGYKRNFAMNLVKTNIVCWMDDDDFLYNESVIARVCCLKFYKKECVYSDSLGVFNLQQESSYVLEGFADIPEGSIMFTKDFWVDQKFDESVSSGEGSQLMKGRELKCVRIPFYFNLIVLNHKDNHTGRLRSRIRQTNRSSTKASLNFYKLFSESFRKILKNEFLS